MRSVPEVTMPEAAFALLSALNIVIDALVTAHPPSGEHIAKSLEAKIRECEANPDLKPTVPLLAMVLSSLTSSARTLERETPQGRA